MEESKKFYVYVHRYASGEKEGEIFYIGKGTGKRIYSSASRNNHWHAIKNKYGRNVEIIKSEMTSDEACKYEIELIKSIGIDNLCNLSPGGDSGAFGYRHTEEWKKKNSELSKLRWKEKKLDPDFINPLIGIKHSEERKEKSSKIMKESWASKSEEYRKNRAEKIKKALNTPESISLRSRINSGERNPSYDKTIRIYHHKNGEIFTGTQHQLIKKYNLNQGNISMMSIGKRKSAYGWRVHSVLS